MGARADEIPTLARVRLENVIDAADLVRLGRSWAVALGAEPTTEGELNGPAQGHGAVTLRRPSGRGSLLEPCLERTGKTVKNAAHLDLRAEPTFPSAVIMEEVPISGLCKG